MEKAEGGACTIWFGVKIYTKSDFCYIKASKFTSVKSMTFSYFLKYIIIISHFSASPISVEFDEWMSALKYS